MKHTCNAWDGSLGCRACNAGLPPDPEPSLLEVTTRNNPAPPSPNSKSTAAANMIIAAAVRRLADLGAEPYEAPVALDAAIAAVAALKDKFLVACNHDAYGSMGVCAGTGTRPAMINDMPLIGGAGTCGICGRPATLDVNGNLLGHEARLRTFSVQMEARQASAASTVDYLNEVLSKIRSDLIEAFYPKEDRLRATENAPIEQIVKHACDHHAWHHEAAGASRDEGTVERVARAQFEFLENNMVGRVGDFTPSTWDEQTDAEKLEFREAARVGLEAAAGTPPGKTGQP